MRWKANFFKRREQTFGNEGINPNVSPTLNYLHRNLNELSEEQLQKAKKILNNVFDDIFNDEEE